MIATTTAEVSAAAAPWAKRAPISIASLWASAADHRSDDEGGEADEEDALAAEEVAEPAGEQQQAAEGDQVAVDHPGQARLAEVEVPLDRGEGDVDDRRVEHDHQLPEADDEERDPPGAVAASRYSLSSSLHEDHHYSKDNH